MNGFKPQVKAMTDAYVEWSLERGEDGLEGGAPARDDIQQGTYGIHVVDMFSS